MPLEAWFTVGILLIVFGLLMKTRLPTDAVLMGGVGVLLVFGIVDAKQAFAGFSNSGVITVGVLFVVAAGVRDSGAIWPLIRGLLGSTKSIFWAQTRLMLPIAAFSGFLNNTPLVAMLVPAITDWSRRSGVASSKLLIPLSYAAILGGMCTLIGTSTNLVVNGLMIERGMETMGVFDISIIGVPCALAGIATILLVGRKLLPDRRPAVSRLDDPRQYTLEMMVEDGGVNVGKTIEEAGLRHLGGVYLMEIDRDGRVIPAVGPEQVLEAGDRLVFVGVVDSVKELRTWPGLVPATNQIFKLDGTDSERLLVEAVVSDSSPLLGKSIREGRFRTMYNAAVIAVARNGERVEGKIGDIELRAGDTLLLEAQRSFLASHRNSRDFFLVSGLSRFTEPTPQKAWIALAIVAGMVLLKAVGLFTMLQAALIASAAMLVTGCLTLEGAKRGINRDLLVAIAAAFGLGNALRESGAADAIAQGIMGLAAGEPWLTLLAIYIITAIFTETVTNNAAAVVVFPIAYSASQVLGVSFTPFAYAIMIAASASFVTPIGYQTNLMVFGPGGYRFTDFTKVGTPVALAVAVVALALLPVLVPF
ncbi:MAG: SLC13 family permease [Sumerlaeia bacterium]